MTQEQLPVGIDVDECVADLLSGCCEFYNRQLWRHEEYPSGYVVKRQDGATVDPKKMILPEDLNGWDLNPYFGAGWQAWLTAPRFYRDFVRPMGGARLGVQRLRAAGERVVFVTSCVKGSTNQKHQWLIDWGFLDEENAERDFLAVKDKKLVRLKALFDDGIHNVDDYPGPAFLVNHWHNSGLPCKRPRVNGIYHALDTLQTHGLI